MTTNTRGRIAAVMVHVSNVEAALDWYSRALPGFTREHVGSPPFERLVDGDTALEFVLADEKVGSGPAGSVVYWRVPHFESALQALQSLGAPLHRGPMRIEDGQAMCQVRDPWGNCLGIRGPSAHDSTDERLHQDVER